MTTGNENSSEMRIPFIVRKLLPSLPPSAALSAFGRNEVHYDPEMWQLDYAVHRYLQRMDDFSLAVRYAQILRNIDFLAGPEWDHLPIDVMRGSWYWHRKEFQNRLEFAMRGADLPVQASLSPAAPVATGRPDVPSGSLFRFGRREHMQSILRGEIRFTPAAAYDGIEMNEARRDEEKAKHVFTPGQHMTVSTMDGKTMPILGDLRKTVHGPDYHMACFTTEWDPRFFAAFNADACLAIRNPEAFAARVKAAGDSVFPGWYFMDIPVVYYDAREPRQGEQPSPPTHKDMGFAYQREHRIFFARLNAGPVNGVKNVNIGRCDDIACVHGIDGAPLRRD